MFDGDITNLDYVIVYNKLVAFVYILPGDDSPRNFPTPKRTLYSETPFSRDWKHNIYKIQFKLICFESASTAGATHHGA